MSKDTNTAQKFILIAPFVNSSRQITKCVKLLTFLVHSQVSGCKRVSHRALTREREEETGDNKTGGYPRGQLGTVNELLEFYELKDNEGQRSIANTHTCCWKYDTHTHTWGRIHEARVNQRQLFLVVEIGVRDIMCLGGQLYIRVGSV